MPLIFYTHLDFWQILLHYWSGGSKDLIYLICGRRIIFMDLNTDFSHHTPLLVQSLWTAHQVQAHPNLIL